MDESGNSLFSNPRLAMHAGGLAVAKPEWKNSRFEILILQRLSLDL